jgi:hypothetical protein
MRKRGKTLASPSLPNQVRSRRHDRTIPHRSTRHGRCALASGRYCADAWEDRYCGTYMRTGYYNYSTHYRGRTGGRASGIGRGWLRQLSEGAIAWSSYSRWVGQCLRWYLRTLWR